MEALLGAGEISSVIELAVAPVFLLASISGALNVLSLRMGRIIDRGRRLNEMQPPEGSKQAKDVDVEQRMLARRAGLINRAIALCTVSGMFVCFVIVALFVDALFALDQEVLIAMLFAVALLSLISALMIFLREVSLSLRAFHFGPYKVNDFL